MRWFSKRSPSGGRHTVGRRATATPAVVHAAPPADFLPPAVPPAGSGVYLGFADGVLLQLDAGDPRARTFRSLARSLAQGAR